MKKDRKKHGQTIAASLLYINLFFLNTAYSQFKTPMEDKESNTALKRSHSTNLTMEDLEILYKNKNHEEFISNFTKILPRARNKAWYKMARQVANDYTQEVSQYPLINKNEFQNIEKLNSLSIMKSNTYFQEKRFIIGTKYFKEMIQRSIRNVRNSKEKSSDLKYLYLKIKKFWLMGKANFESAILFGNLVYQNFPKRKNEAVFDSWFFYNRAFSNELAKFKCTQGQYFNILLEKFITSYSTDNKNFNKWLKKNIHRHCLKELASPLKKLLTSSRKYLIRDIAFEVLKHSKQLSNDDRDLYYLLFLLQGAYRGDTLNFAWKRVENLGEDYKRRIYILKNLLKIDPLPDQLLKFPENPLTIGTINHVSFYFPEYFNTYAQTCIDYLTGSKIFPKGNPTLRCKIFFELAHGKSWIKKKYFRKI